MPTERLSMRRIRDLLRLKYAQGLSDRAVARSLGPAAVSWHLWVRRSSKAVALFASPNTVAHSLKLRPPMSSSSGAVPKTPITDETDVVGVLSCQTASL